MRRRAPGPDPALDRLLGTKPKTLIQRLPLFGGVELQSLNSERLGVIEDMSEQAACVSMSAIFRPRQYHSYPSELLSVANQSGRRNQLPIGLDGKAMRLRQAHQQLPIVDRL